MSTKRALGGGVAAMLVLALTATPAIATVQDSPPTVDEAVSVEHPAAAAPEIPEVDIASVDDELPVADPTPVEVVSEVPTAPAAPDEASPGPDATRTSAAVEVEVEADTPSPVSAFAGAVATFVAPVVKIFTAPAAVSRPAYYADVTEGRVVTLRDQAVRVTSLHVWGKPVTAGHGLVAGVPTIAGASAELGIDGTLLYTPAPGFTGWDEVVLERADGGQVGAVRIIVNTPNGLTNTVKDGSVAVTMPEVEGAQINGIIYITPEGDGGYTPTIAGNDLDAGVSYVTVSTPTHPGATAFVSPATGQLWYNVMDSTGWTGDTITYTVWDNDGNGATGTVTLTAVQAPRFYDDLYPPAATTIENVPVTFDVLANDLIPAGVEVGDIVISHNDGAPGSTELPDGTTVPVGSSDYVVNSDLTVTMTPGGVPGTRHFIYEVLDINGTRIGGGYGRVIVNPTTGPGVPVTYPDGWDDQVPADRASGARWGMPIAAGGSVTVDALANDDIPGGVAAMYASTAAAGWTVEVTDDHQVKVTAPADATAGQNYIVGYMVVDMNGHWASDAISLAIEEVLAAPATIHAFTWAGTPVTVDVGHPANANVLEHQGVDADDLTPSELVFEQPGEFIDVGDGAWEYTPATGYTGVVEAQFETDGSSIPVTVHVLGPQVQDWRVQFPAGASGQVDDTLAGALWGTHADLVTYVNQWVAAGEEGRRSYDGTGYVGFDDHFYWVPRDVAMSPADHGSWPTSAIRAELRDPRQESTFRGQVALLAATMRLASDTAQSAVQTYAGVTTDGIAGPVGRVAVEVADVLAPPPVEPEDPQEPDEPDEPHGPPDVME